MAYTKYSLTPADNNAAPPNGAPEGMLPSAVNDTMRDMMAQIRDCGDGIRGGTYTMTAPVITGGSITGASVSATSLTDSGNLAFTGTGNRITGDFSNATQANRILFQSSTTNGNTNIGAIPNGTATQSVLNAFNSSDPTNAGVTQLICTASESRISAAKTGTGTYLPLTVYTNNAEAMRIDTSGRVGIGSTSPADPLHVQGTVNSGTVRARVQNVSTTASSADLVINAGNNNSYIQLAATYNSVGSLVFASNLTSGQITVAGAYPLVFNTNSTERARLAGDGAFLIGLTADLGSGSALNVASPNPQISVRNTNASSGKYWRFGPDSSSNAYVIYNQSGSGVWIADGGTSWNANSDERLKTDLNPILDGLAKVNSLRSVTGRYKTDEEGVSRSFLIAQDIQKVLPEAITEKDGYLGLAYSDTIPLLVAAIKELSAKVDAQASEIATLKAGA